MQAAHSAEEYAGRLWETFPPAAYLTGLVSADRDRAFLLLNAAIVVFGVWCLFWRARQRAYTPGLVTAPFLLVLALSLAVQMMRVSTAPEPE